MASIKSAYDLTGGETRSSVITRGSYLNLQAFLTTVAGRVSYFVEKRNSSSGDWIPLEEGIDPIVFHTNNSDEDGVSIFLIDSTLEYSVNIVPGDNTTGTLTLDAVTDGTIA